MSMFLSLSSGVQFSAGLNYTPNYQLMPPEFQPLLDLTVFLAPWEDGRLWPNSRLCGPDATSMIMSEDSTCSGRFASMPCNYGADGRPKIVGTTRDSSGNPLGNCTVSAYLTSNDQFVFSVTSDTAGYFTLPSIYVGAQHYLVAYKPDSPADRAGSSVRTIVPV